MFQDLATEISLSLLSGGKRRILTALLLVAIVLLALEASTQATSLFLLNRRIDTIGRLMATTDLPSEEKAKLLALRTEQVREFAGLQDRLDHPGTFIRHRLSRFVAGFWPALVIGFLLVRLSFALFRKMRERGAEGTMSLALGFRALQVVVSFGATNGLISGLWNTSDGIWAAWLVWPAISGTVLLATVILFEVVSEGSAAKPRDQSGSPAPPSRSTE